MGNYDTGMVLPELERLALQVRDHGVSRALVKHIEEVAGKNIITSEYNIETFSLEYSFTMSHQVLFTLRKHIAMLQPKTTLADEIYEKDMLYKSIANLEEVYSGNIPNPYHDPEKIEHALMENLGYLYFISTRTEEELKLYTPDAHGEDVHYLPELNINFVKMFKNEIVKEGECRTVRDILILTSKKIKFFKEWNIRTLDTTGLGFTYDIARMLPIGSDSTSKSRFLEEVIEKPEDMIPTISTEDIRTLIYLVKKSDSYVGDTSELSKALEKYDTFDITDLRFVDILAGVMFLIRFPEINGLYRLVDKGMLRLVDLETLQRIRTFFLVLCGLTMHIRRLGDDKRVLVREALKND